MDRGHDGKWSKAETEILILLITPGETHFL